MLASPPSHCHPHWESSIHHITHSNSPISPVMITHHQCIYSHLEIVSPPLNVTSAKFQSPSPFGTATWCPWRKWEFPLWSVHLHCHHTWFWPRERVWESANLVYHRCYLSIFQCFIYRVQKFYIVHISVFTTVCESHKQHLHSTVKSLPNLFLYI